jgi:phosphoesterase RecJ-like protein
MGGIIDQLRITKGVEVAILLKEGNKREWKVSLRSNNIVDVSKIAVMFAGGGHVRAAGCTMYGSVHDCVNSLTKEIEKQLN